MVSLIMACSEGCHLHLHMHAILLLLTGTRLYYSMRLVVVVVFSHIIPWLWHQTHLLYLYNILLCLYHYLEPFLIYLRYRPSKHAQPTCQLLNCQRLLQPIDELFISTLTPQFIGERPCTDLLAVRPQYHEFAQHGYCCMLTALSFNYLAIMWVS